MDFRTLIFQYLQTENHDCEYEWVLKIRSLIFIRAPEQPDYLICSTKPIEAVQSDMTLHFDEKCLFRICDRLIELEPQNYANFDLLPSLLKFYLGNTLTHIYGIRDDCGPLTHEMIVSKTRRVRLSSRSSLSQ